MCVSNDVLRAYTGSECSQWRSYGNDLCLKRDHWLEGTELGLKQLFRQEVVIAIRKVIDGPFGILFSPSCHSNGERKALAYSSKV